ncbi:MAG: PKD domain-containing protein [Thermoplasmatales archaeon]|nr:MAG: PKD domain-containing protein [Thermoplasmatales archaeon]
MERKKNILLAIALAIAGLMISSATIIPAKISQDNPMNDDINKANIVKLDTSVNFLSKPGFEAISSSNLNFEGTTLNRGVVFDGPGDQLHPGFIRTKNGPLGCGYRDNNLGYTCLTYSTDNGQTWAVPMIGTTPDDDYIDGDLWNDTRVFGTARYTELMNGAYIFVADLADVTNLSTMMTYYWSFPSDYGWHDMIDVEIACDSSQNIWNYGISSYVISTTYDLGYTNGPTVFFTDPAIPWSGWIAWPDDNLSGCAHTDIDIDVVTHKVYAVYDWLNTTSGNWEIVVWTFDFTDPLNWDYHYWFLIKETGNLRYPSVSTYDDNLIILAETDQNGKKDIICYYSDDGVNDLKTVFVADSVDDTSYPDMQHVSGQKFICTYVENNNLFASMTDDGGASWGDSRWQINENDGAVVDEYKTSDLCENAKFVMWEEAHDDIDIYMDFVYNEAPNAPEIKGTENGNPDVIYFYTLNSIDLSGDYIAEYIVDWGDGNIDTFTGPFPPGTDIEINHSWDKQGTYTITANAIDIIGDESQDGTLEVIIPRSRQFSNSVLQYFLQNHPNIYLIIRHLLGL